MAAPRCREIKLSAASSADRTHRTCVKLYAARHCYHQSLSPRQTSSNPHWRSQGSQFTTLALSPQSERHRSAFWHLASTWLRYKIYSLWWGARSILQALHCHRHSHDFPSSCSSGRRYDAHPYLPLQVNLILEQHWLYCCFQNAPTRSIRAEIVWTLKRRPKDPQTSNCRCSLRPLQFAHTRDC